MWRRELWFLALVFALCRPVAMDHAAAAERAAYLLGPGDRLHVTVFNEPDLTGDFVIGDQGSVALPLIGNVMVGGKTVSDAETLITQQYGKNYLVNPRVSIEVLNYRPFFILGEVKSPGSYPYVADMTVLNAIALAGGYTPRAAKGDIVVKHANTASAPNTSIGENDPVLPGDVITVKERFF